MVKASAPKLSDQEFASLAEFRYQIRLFLGFSLEAAEVAGIHPQQHQLLLAVRGMQEKQKPTVAAIAERLQIRHNSAVELAERCLAEGLLQKTNDEEDRRKVVLHITAEGERILSQLSRAHLEELRWRGPELIKALQNTLEIIGISENEQAIGTRSKQGK